MTIWLDGKQNGSMKTTYSIKPFSGTQREDTGLGKRMVEQSSLRVLFVEKEL